VTTGTIAYCSREDQIYPGFAAHLARLCQQHPDAKVLHAITNDIADGRNQCVRQMEGDWLWFIDADMLFAMNTLDRLLAHNVDLVQVLCARRHPPHQPIMWQDHAGLINATPRGVPGLTEVQSLGAGGTLYRRRVFEAIPDPWFEGVLGLEDTCLAQKARLAGFTLYVDTSTPVEHTTPMLVAWEYVNGRWGLRYTSMNGQQLHIAVKTDSKIVSPYEVVGR